MKETIIERPNGEAPSTARYQVGAKGGMVGAAWQYVWDRLTREDFQEGAALVAEASDVFHILPQSIMAHLHRMASEGILLVELKDTETTAFRYNQEFKTTRKRAHFKIAPEVKR